MLGTALGTRRGALRLAPGLGGRLRDDRAGGRPVGLARTLRRSPRSPCRLRLKDRLSPGRAQVVVASADRDPHVLPVAATAPSRLRGGWIGDLLSCWPG